MKKSLFAIITVLITTIAFSSIALTNKAVTQAVAQQMERVCFNVVDETGEPLIGVSVHVKGTTRGAITDMDGNVCIDVRRGEVLVISYIGYQTQEVEYDGKNVGTVNLVPDNEVLG